MNGQIPAGLLDLDLFYFRLCRLLFRQCQGQHAVFIGGINVFHIDIADVQPLQILAEAAFPL